MFHGSIVAMATPMLADGSLDFDALERLVDFHVSNGTEAIVAVGTTGESATVSESEHCELISRVVGFAAGRIPVIAGTGANSTSEALSLTRCARKAGADACLLVAPYYNKPPQEGLFQHFRTLAESVDIPQILYNVPGRTACDLLPETVERLCAMSNIVGIKEASGSLDRIRDLLQRCGDRLALYSGDDALACQSILAGGQGVISVTANVAPALMSRMCRAALAGRREEAEELDGRLQGLHEALFLESNPIPVKWALQRMGLVPEGIRLPLVNLSPEYRPAVEKAMRDAGVL